MKSFANYYKKKKIKNKYTITRIKLLLFMKTCKMDNKIYSTVALYMYINNNELATLKEFKITRFNCDSCRELMWSGLKKSWH